jgi:hypothetical protein
MGYEKLNKQKHTVKNEPVVTIGSQGIFYLNSFVMQKHFKDFKFVDFSYDKDKKQLAIEPVLKEGEDSFRLNFSSASKSTGVIAARSIAKKININFTKTKPYKAEWNSEKKFLEVKLS